MKHVWARGAAGFVASLFVVGLLSPRAVVSSKAIEEEPDITITFRGLMVFDSLSANVQVVRLHSDAEHHIVNIRVVGPDFPQGVDWGHDLPKGVALQFEVRARPRLPDSANWGSSLVRPFDIKTLHRNSADLGDFIRKPDANGFGPIFTFKAGSFSVKEPKQMDFISVLDPTGHLDLPVPTFVEATVAALGTGQIGYLTASSSLDPFPLTKPTGATKWKITVSNEPDYSHVCGFHFREYYKGFEYTRTGPLDYPEQYVAKLRTLQQGPCDVPHPSPLTLDQTIKGEKRKTAIETRPCIPISY